MADTTPDDGALTGALVPAPQPAEIRYENEDASKVARVLVRVERADGTVKEYEAREPQNFTMSDPEVFSAMSLRMTGLSVGMTRVQAAVPSLSLSFSAHPRYSLHIRNSRADDQASSSSSSAVASG